MSSRSKLENKDSRGDIPHLLNVFLCNDGDGLSANESKEQVLNCTQNANTSSIGTIPSNGLVESDVTPVMTPTPKVGVYKPNDNVWRVSKEATKRDRTYVVSAEEYPDLGQRQKRSKQRSPPTRTQDDGGTDSSHAKGFSRVKDAPVLANFLPDFMLSKSSNSNHQAVTTWLSSVRPSDSQKSSNDQARCSSSTTMTLVKNDSVQPLAPKSAAKSSPGEENIQQKQNTPANSQQQETSPANSVIHQVETTNSPKEQQNSSATSLQQQKSSVNSLQKRKNLVNSSQQQKSSASSLKQQKSCASSLPQQKSSVNFTIIPQKVSVNSSQQQKSSASSLQQQKSSASSLQQQKSCASSLPQQKSSVNFTIIPQKVSVNSPQQQKSSASSLQQQKSSASSLQQQKSCASSLPQQKSSVNFTIIPQKVSVNSSQQQKSCASSLPQQKSSVNFTIIPQKVSVNSSQQQKCSASSLQQQKSCASSLPQQKSSVNFTIIPQKGSVNSSQQQKSSASSLQQQRSCINSSQYQKSSASSLQQKSPESSYQVSNSHSKFRQQQKKSPEKNKGSQKNQKSPGIQHSWKQQQEQQQPKSLQNCSQTSVQQQQQQVNPNHSQSQSGRPIKPTYSHSRRALVTNNSPVPISIHTVNHSQQTRFQIQSSSPSVVHNEDEDVMPPTPNQSERRQKRFPRRNHNHRMVRSLQAVSREFTESSPEGPLGGLPEKEVVPYQQHEHPPQVKRSPEIQQNSHIQQLPTVSALNLNAKEFNPTAKCNPPDSVCKLSRRRCRQRFMRSSRAKQQNQSEPGPNPESAPEPILECTSEIGDQPQQPVNIPIQPNLPPAPALPMVFFDQQAGVIWSNPSPYIPIEIQNTSASLSVFRLASLPCTGVGTPNMDIFTISPPTIQHISSSRLPSSISRTTQLSHTLSSPPVENQHQEHSCSHQDEDLMYSRPLLDMDQEETQPEQQDQEWQWESEMEPPRFQSKKQVVADALGEKDAPVAKDAGSPLERHMIFRAPSQHGQEYPKPDLNCVPSSIRKLHYLISSQYSDYSFVYALSAQICQDCVPMDCFVYLKMILLASIVSIESDEVRAPISLCIIASDSLMASRLMNKVGQLAPRFLGPHEYGLQPTFNALPSRFNWVVASPLLLAQQGVYYVGDWNRLSKDQGCQLEKCVENGAVPVAQLHVDQPLKAAVWTYWQPNNSTNQTLALAKLCPIFGLPIYMGGQVNNSLWHSIIQKHNAEGEIVVNDGLNIPEDDMRMLIHLLHQRKTTLTDPAQHMLQKYYVISRKERPNVFSSKTYIVLKQLAECFAKLALRLEVLESDVCVAIYHCEHFVQGIFGAKENQAPPAVFNFNVISSIDPYMNKFTRWLLQYLNSYEDEELGMHADKKRRTDSWAMP
nr:AF4/FMR2 family member lilli isoform X2 [Drosophila simulans]